MPIRRSDRLIRCLLSVGLGAAALVSGAQDSPASTEGLDAAERLLARNAFREAAASYRELLESDGLSDLERARVHRGLAIALDAREEVEAQEQMLEAVVAEPEYEGNSWLLTMVGTLQGIYGSREGWPAQLARLEALIGDHPRLRSHILHLRAAHDDILGHWDEMVNYPASVGVLCDLLLLGPFDNVAGSGMTRPYPPEDGIDLDAVHRGLDGRPLRWTPPRCDPYGMVDLDEYMDSEANAVLYAMTHVRVEQRTLALLHVSGAGAFRTWVDGTMVIDERRHRTGTYELLGVPIELGPGWHRILVKVGAEFERLNLRLRLTGPDGSPLGVESSGPPPEQIASIGAASAAPPTPMPFDHDWRVERWRDWPLGTTFVDRLVTVRDLIMHDLVDEAETLLAELTDLYPESALVDAARLSVLRSKESPEAEGLAKTIPAKAPQLFGNQLTRFQELRDRGEDDAAFEMIEEMLVEFPNNLVLQAFHGSAQMGRGDTARGLAAVEEAFEAMPTHRALQTMLLNALDNLNRKSAHGETLERIHELRPDLPDHARALAARAHEAQDADRALSYLDRALRANGPQARIHQERATVLESVGRNEEAIVACEEALSWAPQNVGLRHRLARMLLAADREEEAVGQLETALALDPASDGVRELLRTVQGKPQLSELFPEADLQALRSDDLAWADPSAGACYLLDDVQMIVFESGATEYRRHYAILVRDAGGAANYRTLEEITGPMLGGDLEIARALKVDGRIIEGEVGYGEITFPDLEAGDVIEVRVSTKGGPVAGLPGHFWTDNRFQYEASCLLSRFSLLTPAGLDFDWTVHNGELRREVTELDEWRLHSWEAREQAALRFEDAGPAFLDYALWIDVSSVPTWDVLVDWFRGESEGRLRTTPELLAFLEGLETEAATDSARIYAITTWVRENVEYEGGQFVDSPTVPRAPAEVLETRYGDCKDQSGLIISALRALGVEANFALVNARDVLTKSYLPSPRFSHAIVHARAADGSVFWIDPTHDQLGFPNVPVLLEGMTALLIDESERAPFVTIPLDSPETDGSSGRIGGSFPDEDVLELVGESAWTGEEAAIFRTVVRTMPEYVETIVEQLLGSAHPGATVEDWSHDLGTTREDDFVLRFSLRVPSPLADAGSLRILRIPWTMWSMPSELVATRKRQTPLEMAAWRGVNREEIVLALPEGMAPMSLPEPVVLDGEFGRFELTHAIDDDGRLRSTKTFVSTRLRVESEEYDAFRDFVLSAVKAEREQVVLQGGQR